MKLLGVFQVLNKLKDKVFTDEDEDLIIAIGSSAGIALENASLFKKQQLMYEEQKRSFNSFVNTLSASIDARDKVTAGHSRRVTGYATIIAEHIGLDKDYIEAVEYAAMLHDFGKIGVKDSVLYKEGKLTLDEYEHIKRHAVITSHILKNMFFEQKLKDVPEIASSHHERYDGAGYFRGLKGEEIPLGGRILAVSDVFDAITSNRHYRNRIPIVDALDLLKKNSGSHFDPNIVDAFFDVNMEKILTVLFRQDTAQDEIAVFKDYSITIFYNLFKKEERSEDENKLIEIFEKNYCQNSEEL